MYSELDSTERAAEEVRIRSDLPGALFLTGNLDPGLAFNASELSAWQG
jgi:hypothetical protein